MEEKEEDKGEEVKSEVQKKDLMEKMQRKNRKLPYGEEDRRRERKERQEE